MPQYSNIFFLIFGIIIISLIEAAIGPIGDIPKTATGIFVILTILIIVSLITPLMDRSGTAQILVPRDLGLIFLATLLLVNGELIRRGDIGTYRLFLTAVLYIGGILVFTHLTLRKLKY